MQPSKAPSKTSLKNIPLAAFVDGSFNKANNTYGSGIVLLKHGQILDQKSIPGNNPTFSESFQIAGEVLAALHAIKWALDHQASSLVIFYDYQGIASWATEEWTANRPISQYYQQSFQKIRDTYDLQIQFHKVKAHSGDYYNELADQLAKKAVGLA